MSPSKPSRIWTRKTVERAIEHDDIDGLIHAVIAVSMHCEDQPYAVSVCLRLARHPHYNVRGNAVLGFGHIARVHGALDRDVIQPIILAALQDEHPHVRGHASSAVDDTKSYLGWKYPKSKKRNPAAPLHQR